jgi:hypothetical protein
LQEKRAVPAHRDHVRGAFEADHADFGVEPLMSLSGMIEIPRLQVKRGFVMPAQSGIQDGGGWKKANLDTAFAGMTEKRKSTSSRR